MNNMQEYHFSFHNRKLNESLSGVTLPVESTHSSNPAKPAENDKIEKIKIPTLSL